MSDRERERARKKGLTKREKGRHIKEEKEHEGRHNIKVQGERKETNKHIQRGERRGSSNRLEGKGETRDSKKTQGHEKSSAQNKSSWQ